MLRKVLYVCPNSQLGGAEQVTLLLSRYHDRSRWTPHAYFLKDGPLVKEFEKLGARVHLRKERGSPVRLRNPLSILSEARFISQVIRSERIDLVHSCMGYGHILGGLAARLAGAPATWFQHGPTGNLDWIASRVPSDILFTNSDFTSRQQARFRASTRSVKRIYLGTEPLDPRDWTEKGSQYRATASASPGTVTFGLFARISPMKGHLLLVDAAKELMSALPSGIEPHFLIVGRPFLGHDDTFHAEVKAQIAKHGLESRFEFLGHLSPPYSAMSACDVVVNCSVIAEPFGLTIIEAMMLEKPVIAPAAGGPLEIVDDGETGTLFEPGNASSLAQAMLKAASSPELRRKMGDLGRRRALERFHVERMVREIESAYDSLAGSFQDKA